MYDKYGRELTYLRISLIDRCNLKCFYCMPKGFTGESREGDRLSMDEIAEAVSLFAELGIQKIRLTGGEPLLRKGVPALVRQIKKIPGIREVVMTTNGVLLSHFAEALKEAGLDRINVSLDTLDRNNFKKITSSDSLEAVLRGIQAASEAGIGPIKINAVLMKDVNDHEIMELVHYAIERKFHLRFIEWMPTSAEMYALQENRFLSSEFARHKIEEDYRLVPDESEPHSPARAYFVEGTKTKIGFISPLSNAFCSRCNRLRLKANGMMKTCLHGKEDLDIKSLLRQGSTRMEIKKRIVETVFDRPEEHFLNKKEIKHNEFLMAAVGG